MVDASTFSRKALDLIISEEGLDQPSKWPGEDSGISIGRGYDLGTVTEAEFRADWSQHLAPAVMDRLAAAIGVHGDEARQMASRFRDIAITAAAADAVFLTRTLPTFIERTARAFPGAEQLPEDAFGALVSLVYNRGESLGTPGKSSWDRRSEMRGIKAILARGYGLQTTLDRVAILVRQMKRLWPSSAGLRARRDAEADLIENADDTSDA